MSRLLLTLALCAVCARGAVIPAGTDLHIRLLTGVSSSSSKLSTPVEAVVIVPVVVQGTVLLASGTKLAGVVASARQAANSDERAELALTFNRLLGAKPVTAKTRVVNVDNARESVDDAGKILGILVSETLAAQIDKGIGKVAERNPGFAGLLEAAKAAVLKQQPTGEINYEPGTELTVRVIEPVEWHETATAPALAAMPHEQDLYVMVNAQPFQTMAEKPRKPSDITSLMFIATEEELAAAFKAAGWTTAHELSAGSVLETVAAVAEMRGYKEAPMSILLLDGKRSDFDFQKQNNTFAKRHHLRVWRRADTFLDKPVWVSSATHDIGIEFSQENRTFIHVIDPEIDRERAKIVSDLMFTGRVRSLALVERPAIPRKTRNATGDDIVTDGRMAVVVLK